MKFIATTTILAGLAASVLAAPGPMPAADASVFSAQLTFLGADPNAFYTASVPADGSVVALSNPLSVSKIRSQGGATCTSFGNQAGNARSVTTVVGANTVDVGPPQPQVSVTCRAL